MFGSVFQVDRTASCGRSYNDFRASLYRDGERELFDLAVDPDETENLAADPADEHVGTIEDLAGDIFDWQVRTRDPIYLP